MNITDMNIADGQVMLSQFHESLFDIERIPFAALALIATMIVGAVTGPFMARAVPLMWVAQDLIFGRIGARLDRTRRKQADLMFRGFLFMVFVLALMLIGIKGAGALQSAVPYIGAWYVEVLALCGLLSCGALWGAALALFKTLDQKEKPSKGAYFTLSRTTLRDLNSTDDFGLTRLSLATIVRQLDKGAVSPLLWYVIGGLPLALITSTLSFMAWRFGKDGFGKGFGVIMLALDKLVGFVPTLLSGVLLQKASARPHMRRAGSLLQFSHSRLISQLVVLSATSMAVVYKTAGQGQKKRAQKQRQIICVVAFIWLWLRIFICSLC